MGKKLVSEDEPAHASSVNVIKSFSLSLWKVLTSFHLFRLSNVRV